MKIGISAKGGSMEAEVEPRFGRCAYFLIVDSETMRFEAFSNPATTLRRRKYIKVACDGANQYTIVHEDNRCSLSKACSGFAVLG